MKWVALLLVAAGAIGVPALLSDREPGCEGGVAFSPGGFRDADVRGPASPEEALGSLLDDAAEITRDQETRSEGQQAVVVFRGYDQDEHLLKKIEIWQAEDGRWYEGRSWVCS
ncbi:hypothetical protein [Nocardioides zhouii]|uniref:Uncharacterized protein n=1 Tax=Nocardioides zhouii TaxID=1168729 RepID=A0A4Q2SZK2_9ACTN|nr:hypothetical protein [Nocardioides zhouii]RYC11502.1 hypothetical protein EUA94_09055 [Nocardioides zhouii]